MTTATSKSYVDVDRTLGPVLDIHAADGKAYTELSARVKAADGDRDAAVAAFIASSDDPKVVKLKAVIDKATSDLQAFAEQNVKSETLSDEDKEKLMDELSKLRDKFRDGRKAISSIAESMRSTIDFDGVAKALEEIGDPTRSGRGRKVGDPGSSLPKASATLVVSNSNDTWTFDTFGQAAKLMNVTVEQLQKAYAEAAGVQHSEIASVSKPQEFKVHSDSAGDFLVKTSPKERKKPGPRPGGNAANKPA